MTDTSLRDNDHAHHHLRFRSAISVVAHAAHAIGVAEDEIARAEMIAEGARILIGEYERAEARGDYTRMSAVWPYLREARVIVETYDAQRGAVAIERARVAVDRVERELAPRMARRALLRGRGAACPRRAARSRTSRRRRCAASRTRARDGDDGDGDGIHRRRTSSATGGAS